MTGLLLDVEGTTTPIEFVTGTLFPFARERFPAFLRQRASDPGVRAEIEALRAEHGRESASDPPPPWREDDHLASATAHVFWLQGRIWEAGFRAGTLVGTVYPDVPPALRRWKEEGREACIFSSGSVLAQRLLFAHSTAGDLTPCLAAFFDTVMGSKREAASYRRIAAARGRAPAEWLFLSDVTEELEAAREAGMRTALVVRPGRPEPGAVPHPIIRTFDELRL